MVEVPWHSRILDHVQEWEEDVGRPLAEPDIGIEAVLKQQGQEVAHELEAGRFVLVAGQRNVFSGRKVQDVQRSLEKRWQNRFLYMFHFLTATYCPKRDFYTHTHTSLPPPLENATDFCTALCLLVLGHKAAKVCTAAKLAP